MNEKPFYKNRKDAASKLGKFLVKYKNSNSVILSIPNGGIPIGIKIAEDLKLNLFLAPIKKIKHPDSNEVNIGALSINHIVLDQDMGIAENMVSDQIAKLRAELKEDLEKNGLLKDQPSLKGKNVILTDDGITSGSTMLATLQLVEKENPLRKILAIPVANYRSLYKLQDYVDEIVCLHMPETVDNVASYYESFDDLANKELVTVIKQK